jgi:hypothetical protein
MKAKFIPIIGFVIALVAGSVIAQQVKRAKHPKAAKALAKIVLRKDYGNLLKFESREFQTDAWNDVVPSLNGMMFMRWKGDDEDTEVEAVVLWFEQKDALIKFYESTTKRDDYKLDEFNGKKIWKIGENGYTWTDGEHFLVSMGGSPRPPDEMVNDFLGMISNKVAGIEEQRKKEQAPREPEK